MSETTTGETASGTTTTPRTAGYQRHPLEIGPLVFGLVFLGVVAAWGLFELGVVTAADTAWILPIVLIGAGALGVVLALTKPRRTEARQAALAAYASQGAPAGHPERGGADADPGVDDDAHAYSTTPGTSAATPPATAPGWDDVTRTDVDLGTADRTEELARTDDPGHIDRPDADTDSDTDTDTDPDAGTDAGTRERHDD